MFMVVPLAFGGEATPVDYARAIADGALLALIASLGLLLRVSYEYDRAQRQVARLRGGLG